MRRLGGIALLVLGVVVLAAPASAEDKSYFFPLVRIDATVLPDGSLKLLEHRTFEFHGSFTYAYFDIDWPAERIENFRVLEHGRKLVSVAPSNVEGKFRGIWTYTAQDERRTFTIGYTARCAVDVFADTAHLLWQFIGTGWSVPTEHARIVVHVPGRASRVARPNVRCPSGTNDVGFATTALQPRDIRAWGHGPFNGTVRIPDPQTVVYDVHDVPPNAFVEGSIVFPPRSVPKAFLVRANQLSAILTTERGLADDANALRDRHRLERRVALILYGALPILFLLLVLIAYRRDGVSGVPRHLQEPPEDMHPVQLAYMWAAYTGRFSPKNAYRAQLLHLADIHAIEISAVGQVSRPEDFTLRLLKEPDDELDRDFTGFLFVPDTGDGHRSVSLESLKATGKRRSKLLRWTKDATSKTKATAERVRKGKSRVEGHLAAAAGILGAIGTYAMGKDVAGNLAFGVIPVALVGWFLAARFMPPRLDPELRERLARWKAFRRFLKRFSSLPDAPALAVVIWEKYMVEAVALGVANRVEKQVRALVAEEDLPSPWPGAPPGQGGYMWLHTFQTSPVTHAVAVVHSSTSGGWGSSSSSGGFSGGGFSGGGGGGGGGTGGGAG